MAVKRPRIKPTGPMVAGLPTFTPAQFAQARPGGSYKAYRNFINTRRGVVPGKPAWPGRGGPGLPNLMSMIRNVQLETPAQVEARANRMTAANIAAQKGLVLDEAKRAQADALRRSKAMSQAGLAAANLNRGLFSSVGGEYNRAAQELADVGTGVVGNAVAGTNANVQATNEALARVGAPGVEATGAMAGPAQAGVAAYRSAGLPAQRIAEQGQAAQFGLAGMVNAQNLRATQEAQAGLVQAGYEIQQNRAQAIAEIARGRPELAAKFLTQVQEAQRQQTALAMSLLEARRGALQTGFEQGITKRQQTAAELAASRAHQQQIKENRQWTKQFDAAQQQASLTAREVDENRSIALGWFVDRQGNPILKNGKKIKVPKTAATGSTDKPDPIRERMAYSANRWVTDRLNERRGTVSGTKEQLVNYLLTIYPGNTGIARAIADSAFPAGSSSKGSGKIPDLTKKR